jgi:hypothetical protein
MRLSGVTGGVGALGIGYSTLTSVGDSGLAVLGKVGIGTDAPNAKLAVTGGGIRVSGYSNNSAGDGVNVQIGTTGGVNYLQSLNGTSTNNLIIDGNQILFRTGVYSDSMTLDSSGNLGIGATSPNNKLTVQADATGASFADNGVAQIIARGNTDSTKRLGLGIDTTNNIGVIQAQKFGTGTYPLAINPAGGDVGIGTSSPGAKLHVSGGNIRLDNNQGVEWGGGNNFIYGNEATDFVAIATNGTEKMRLTSTGTLNIVGAGTAGSTQAISFNGSTPVDTLVTTSGGLVGVGTASPASKLEVRGVSASIQTRAAALNSFLGAPISGNVGVVNDTNSLVLQVANTVGGNTAGVSIAALLEASASNQTAMVFSADDGFGSLVARMRLNSSGNLGIGTSSPAVKLHVVGANGSGAVQIGTSSGSNQYQYVTFGGSVGGTDYGWQIGRSSNTSGLGGNGAFYFYDIKADTTRMSIDSSGNLGLGVPPSAWRSNTPAFQIGSAGVCLFADSGVAGELGNNLFLNSSSQYIYLRADPASRYKQYQGVHSWLVSTNTPVIGDPIVFSTAMTLDASGNLLVGTTTSSNRTITVGLSIALADANGGIYFGATGTPVGSGGFGVNAAIARAGGTNFHITGSADGDLCIAPEGTKAILFGTSASASSVTERARITSGGDFRVKGAGTAGSTEAFQVSGSAPADAARLDSNGYFDVDCTATPDGTTRRGFQVVANTGVNDTTKILIATTTTSTRALAEFNNGNGNVGSISVTGSATAYNTSSDYRLKDNPQPLTNSGAFIDALKPKTWNWKADGSKGVGFIAHEVQEVSPGSVVGGKDGEQMQAMEYGSAEFVANIIAELQSLRARIAQLEAK